MVFEAGEFPKGKIYFDLKTKISSGINDSSHRLLPNSKQQSIVQSTLYITHSSAKLRCINAGQDYSSLLP
jgi:hypothetical protein